MQRKPLSILATNPLAGVFVALVIIFVVSAILSPYFLTSYNMSVIARSLAFVGLVTVGQAMLLILGELDLSLGVIGGLCGVIAGMLMVNYGINPAVAIAGGLAMGAALGFFNGFMVTSMGLHSLVLTKVVAITNIPKEIQFLGRGDLLGVPVPFLVMIAVLFIATFITLKTPFGRYMYAIGNNKAAARMLGIRVDRIRILVFTIAGFLSALAGLLMVARLGTAQPSIGETWVLPPIAASVIGGVATTGGIGTPLGAILGAGIIAIIENIIVLFGVSPYWQGVVSGVIVVLAISFDAISRRYIRKEV